MTKEIKDMRFDEFVDWATGLLIIRLGAGQTVRSTIWEILNNFLLEWLPANDWVHKDKRRGK